MNELLRYLNPPEASRIDFTQLAINLCVGALLATLLRLHYVRFSRSLANRDDFAHNFLIITSAIILIISIVKNSLPLSVGLVGALSIVRFRTPIKDPEELSYLFLAIGLGVGLGAGYPAVTAAALAIILLLIAALRRPRSRPIGPLYLEVNLPEAPDPGAALSRLTEVLARSTDRADLRRMEAQPGVLLAGFAIRCARKEQLSGFTTEVVKVWPRAVVTVLDQEHFPGV